jgi:DNA-binding TFAR19-related protein (PDSD5 family)
MEDDELAAIRAARLKELQQQSSQVSAFICPSIMA